MEISFSFLLDVLENDECQLGVKCNHRNNNYNNNKEKKKAFSPNISKTTYAWKTNKANIKCPPQTPSCFDS